jgi:multicomponent Na+:H+ antiporter subunit D
MIDLSSVPNIPPGFIFIFGAVLLPLLGKGKASKIYLIILAALGLISVAVMREPQTSWVFSDLIFLQVDRLSLLMGYIFTIAGGCAILYSLPTVKDNGHHMCALLYLGSALGAVFAGDFFSLYIFWEIMAFSSLGLIWYEGSQRARDAGMRYILFHLFGGCALLGGIVLHYMSTGSIAIGPVEYGIGYFLLLLGIGVNTAFILLHTWLPDSYPKATIAGTIFLSIFTTKTGVYVLARTFSGAEISIHGQEFLFVAYIGGAMCLYGVIFAILQNDVRKLLSYHIVSQLGYMVAGVGMGALGLGVIATEAQELAIDGAFAHLFNNLLFKTTLFMCMGAVIYRTGKNNLTDMGGLAKKMPITMITCVIAALSISGIVGFNGFISKGMVIHAAEMEELHLLVLVLTLGSVGTLISFIKLTYFAFFSKNKEIEAKEAPIFMLIPMCVTAFLCIAIGVHPQLLYNILPFVEATTHYHAFASGHTVGVVELVLMTVFLFFMIGFFAPHEKITYDVDYIYRKIGRGFIRACEGPLVNFASAVEKKVLKFVDFIVKFSENPRRETRLGIGTGVLLVILFFVLYLITMFMAGWLSP